MKNLFLLFTLVLICTISKAQNNAITPYINHVFLSVSDIDSSTSFYTNAFDLKVTQRFKYLEINRGDETDTLKVKIAFLKFPGQDFVYELSERTGDSVAQPGLFQHIGIEVDDIESTCNEFHALGAEPIIPIRTVKTDGDLEIKQAFFKGPDGEHIELIELISGEY